MAPSAVPGAINPSVPILDPNVVNQLQAAKKQRTADLDNQSSDIYKPEAPRPAGSWSNTLQHISNSLTQFVAKPLAGVTNMVRNVTSPMPLLYDENGELSHYGKTLDKETGQSIDPLGRFILALNGATKAEDAQNEAKPLPDTFLGNTASGIIGVAPDIAATALFPESKVAEGAGAITKLKAAVWNPFTKLLVAKGAVNGYNDAAKMGKTPEGQLMGGAIGAVNGGISGGTMGILGGIAGGVTKPIIESLGKAGLVKAGSAALTSAGVKSAADATLFAALPLATAGGEHIVNKLIDAKDDPKLWENASREAESGFGMGLGFGLLHAYHSIGENTLANKDIKEVISDRQAVAMQNFLTATPEAIAEAYKTPDATGDLNAKAAEYADKASKEIDPDKKRQLILTAQTFAKASDVKGVYQTILEDKDGFVKHIQQSDIPDELKAKILDKVEEVHATIPNEDNGKVDYTPIELPQNEQTVPNQEVPVEAPANEPGKAQEPPAPVNEPTGNTEKPVRAKIADADAPTLPDVSRNLNPVGEPGIAVEPSFEREYGTNKLTDKPLENGQKYVVSRGTDGKVNGALEISYQSREGVEKEPQAVKVVVDEGSRRQGIATALFKHAEEQGIDLSKVRGTATTNAGQALYEANKKGENKNAIPVEKPNEVDVLEPGAVGEEVGTRNAEPKKSAGESEPSVSVQKDEEAPKIKATGDALDVPGLKDSEYSLAATELPNGKHGVFETNSGKLISNLYDSREELLKNFEKSKDKITPDAVKAKVQAGTLVDNAKELKPEERKEADELLAPDGITIKDIENYESELQQQPGGIGEPAPAENNAEAVQQSKDEPTADAGENTSGKESQGQPDVTNEKQAAILKEIDDAKKEINDFIKSSRKNINSFGGALGASFEFVGKAGKLLAAYSKLGIYKFGEFIDKIRADFGDEFADENINGFRSAYAAMRDGADKKERAKFDDSEAVDDYIATSVKQSPVAPVIERDAVADLKDAGKNKATLEKSVAKEAPNDELLKEFASLDPRYFTPDEVAAYNELTKEATPSSMQRDAIAKFIDDFHERQADDAEKRQADWYKQIQEDDELSQAEAQKVLAESAEITDAQPDLENTEQDKKAKNAFSKIITQYKKDLRAADVPADMGDVKKALLEVDETKLSTRQAREIAKVMDGILYDGNYAGAGKAVALSKAVENAKAIAADLEKRGFDKGDLSQFWADFRTLDQNVEMIAKSSKGASVIQDKAGIHEISAGNAKVNKLANDISKAYEKLTNGMGRKILDVENRYKRGMLASILQVADNDLPSDSFERYKNYIKETGEILSKSKVKVEQKEGELVTELYNQFMYGKEDAAAVIDAITKDNPNNTRIVNFFIKQFEPTYGELRRNTLLYQGKDLPFIQQYTPTQMKRLRGYDELATPEVSITDPISFNGMDEPTDTKSARTTIARKPLKTLKGTKRVLNLDFDGLALNKYRESQYDIHTMESRHLFDNIRKLGDFKDALGGRRNVNVVSNGVSNMVQRQKGFNRTSPEARAAIQLLNVVSGKGVRIALQGTAQFLKQYPSVGLNTLANLGGDMDLYFKSIARFGLHDPIFDKSGIGLRASQHGGTSFELDLRKVQNTDFSGPVVQALSKMTQFGDKMNRVFSYALTTADDAVARNSWGAYYMQDLRKQGVDLDNVDWSNEHKNINQEAAAYAEQMVSRNQIQNDPSKQANFLYGGGVESGKDVGSVLLKGLAFPFSSFARNAQARLESDLRKFSGGDRKEATVSIISGIAEAAAFNALKIAVIGSVINAGAAAILPKFGFNKPADKDLEDRAKQIPAQALNDVLLSGFGALADNAIIKGLNRVANPENDKKVAQWLVPNYDPGQYGEPDFGLAGIYGVLPGKLYQLQKEANYIDGEPTGEAYDSHKKEMVKYQSQLTERQQNMAQIVFAIDVLGVLGISDAEVLRLNQKLYREMAKEKAPVKFHSGYNKNRKAKPIVVK